MAKHEVVPTRKPMRKKGEPRDKREVVFVLEEGRVQKRKLGRQGLDCVEFSELPQWVKLALSEYVSTGCTLAEAAERHDKALSTLARYSCSEAGKAWKEQVAAVVNDPAKVAELMLRASVAGTTVLYLQALDTAVSAGDYREVGVMSRDILDRMQVGKGKDAAQGGRQQIIINLGGMSLEAPTVQTSYEETSEVAHEADWAILEEGKDDGTEAG